MTLSGKIFLFSRLLCSNLRCQRTLCLCVWVLLLEGPNGLQRLWFLQQFLAGKRQIRMQKDFASPISHSVVSGLVQILSVENKLLNARTFIYCLLCILLFSISFIKLLMILSLTYISRFHVSKIFLFNIYLDESQY